MLNRIKSSISKLDGTFIMYLALSLIFILGIILGNISVNFIQDNEIKGYVDNLLGYIREDNIQSGKILWLSVIEALKAIAILLISGTTSLGIIFLPGYLLVKGYAYGAVVGVLYKVWGYKAFFVVITAITPQAIFYFFAITYLSFILFQKILANKKGKKVRFNLWQYALPVAMFLIVCIMDAYVQPFLIRYIDKLVSFT